MGGGRRGLALGVALAVLPGLVLIATPASAEPRTPVRSVPLSMSSPPLAPRAPSIPVAEGALSVPADWNKPLSSRARRHEADLPATGREVVERRDAATQVFENADGTETVKVHGEAVHYRPRDGSAWLPIDNSIVPDPDRAGWVRNTANSWTVRFGPITSGGGGVELETDAGIVRFAPDVAKAGQPVVNGNTVTYPNVWPGVDVRYTVSGGQVRTDVLTKDLGKDLGKDEARFPFLADGLGSAVRLQSPVDTQTEQLTKNRQRLTMSAASSTLAVVGASQACSYGLNPGEVWCDGVSTGTNRYPPAQHWWLRGVAQFNYRPYVETKDVLYAGVWMSQSNLSTSDPELVNIWQATGWSGHGAVAGGDPAYWIDEEVVQNDNHCFGSDVCFDVTDTMHNWQLSGVFNGWWDGKFGFSPEEDDYPGFLERFSYKNFHTADIALVLNLNTRPPAPGLVGPENGALAIDTLTPTLRWSAVTDADGDPVKYTAKIATGPDGESGLVATSPETTGLEWTVPQGVLRDGVTYYWKVFANDTKAWTPSGIHKLTVDRRLGGGASPVDTFSGVQVNLVSGNASLSVDGPDLETVGGGIDVDLVYNGRPSLTGLKGTYREDKDRDQVVDPEDPVKLVRTDSQVSFAWGDGAPPSVPVDYFLANWSGTIRTPTGNWQLGVRADDGTRIWVDGVKVVDRWVGLTPTPVYQSGSITGLHKIQFDYFEHTAPAYVELWARNAANPAQAFIVPADWLAPDAADMAAGWSIQAADSEAEYTHANVSEGSISLTETDGSALTFTKQADGGYKPPEGTDDVVNLNADGRVSVHDDGGMSYVFRPDGGLESVVSALDDRRPAAARNHYDGLGRLSRINDPVSGRDVTFRYATVDGDPSCPNVPPLGKPADFESEIGMLCRISLWDGTSTDLYYHKNTDLLSHIAEPGDSWWGFSYDNQGRITAIADPMARDVLFSGVRTDSDITRLFTKIEYTGDGMASRVKTVTSPAALQTDTQRPQRTYGYTQNASGGILVNGSATVTRAGVSGTTDSVAYDHRGRETSRSDALGRTTRQYWDLRDLIVATETQDGLLTATFYNKRNQPTDSWGPAPKDWFDKIWYGSDLFIPKPDKQALIPHDVTRYDEGLDGLDVRWWNNIGRTGPVDAHQYNGGNVRESFPSGSIPEGIAADNTSARFTGDIVFDAKGDYHLQICAGANDLATLSVDDQRLVDVWAVPNLRCGSPPHPFRSGGPNEVHRIQIDFIDLSGEAMLHLNWTKPNGTYEPVPGSALRPGYGMVTSTVDDDGKTTKTEYIDAAAGIGPQHGLVTRTTVDPGGLNLTETTTYEPAGGTDRFLRPLTQTRPSGAGSTTRSTYYGNTEQRDNPCTAVADPANQGGLLKLDTAADPDGTGAALPIVREVVYDKAGRVVAARSGSGTLTAADWICTAYDARGRITETRYPAFGGEPARTVTNNYRVDPDGSGPRPASPLVTSTTDPAGTVTTEEDLLERDIAYTDVFGNTTRFTYDLVDRETSSMGPVGTLAKAYDNLDRLTSLSRDGGVLANAFGYDNADRLTTVTYPTGGGNGTKGTFTYDGLGHRKKITWTGPGGALITSDEVTTRDLGGDVLGQITDGVEHHPGTDYTYDAAGRLVDAWVPGARYAYQFYNNGYCAAPDSYKNANRTAMTVTPTGGSAASTAYCYDHADKLTGVTDASVGTIAYDRHGNTTGIFGEAHTYDATDRHTATTKGTTTLRYVRDATDRIVERRVNGATLARYGSIGSGDASDFTTDTANRVLEATVVLPGGVLLTTRSAGNVWSYPNSHGNVVAIANQSGVKQGPTRVYDPFGGLLSGTLPDNSHGDFDYGWLGENQRPVEHQTGLQPIIEMGSRQYSPLLGRFLEVDPIDGGSANDYDYCSGDAINCTDLDGNWGMPKFVKKALKKTKKWAKKTWKKTKKWGKKAWKKVKKAASNCLKNPKKCAKKALKRFKKWARKKAAKFAFKVIAGVGVSTALCMGWRTFRDRNKSKSAGARMRDVVDCASPI